MNLRWAKVHNSLVLKELRQKFKMKLILLYSRTGKVDPRPNGNFVVILPKTKDIKIKVCVYYLFPYHSLNNLNAIS